jgi:DNA-binding transcriptional LysR family regulator
MLDLSHFRCFVRIVECGGLTAASRNLNGPKSTVSHHLQLLEMSLGVRAHRPYVAQPEPDRRGRTLPPGHFTQPASATFGPFT